MMAEQLVLDLPARPALGRAAFFVAPANRLALAQVDSWPAWPGGRLAVTGPQGAGKTHLAHVWAQRSGARILPATALPGLDIGSVPEDAALAVEDVDRLGRLRRRRAAAEEALFRLCNRLAAGGSLMVSGRRAPARWSIRLPDLASRLRAAAVARLEPPDDALLAAVLVKLFADRQLEVGPGLIRYLLGRMDRSFAAAEALVAALDRAGLARHRPITARLAAEVLASDAGEAMPGRPAPADGLAGTRR
jgi:chromosomal replication initiation ATPase DnaA